MKGCFHGAAGTVAPRPVFYSVTFNLKIRVRTDNFPPTGCVIFPAVGSAPLFPEPKP